MHTSSLLRRLLTLLGVMPMCVVDGDAGAVIEEDQATDEADTTQAEGETPEEDGAEVDESDEVVITIGDATEEAAQQEEQTRAPDWVRDLRKQNREKDRRIRELEARVNQPAANSQPATLGAKPTLAACDYDEEKFDRDLEAWHATKRQIEDAKAKTEQAEQAGRAAWQAKLDAYNKAKTALKVKDFEDAEGIAQDTFSTTQQGVILNGADDPAKLVYALGKNPKKAKELASIADPVKFAFAVAKLETQLKVTPRKVAPLPERTVRGSAVSVAGPALERLREEAQRTGNYSKYLEAKRQATAKKSA